jgi:hypothetical protein
MAAAMIERATGTKNAVALTNVDSDWCPRHRSDALSAAWLLSFAWFIFRPRDVVRHRLKRR